MADVINVIVLTWPFLISPLPWMGKGRRKGAPFPEWHVPDCMGVLHCICAAPCECGVTVSVSELRNWRFRGVNAWVRAERRSDCEAVTLFNEPHHLMRGIYLLQRSQPVCFYSNRTTDRQFPLARHHDASSPREGPWLPGDPAGLRVKAGAVRHARPAAGSLPGPQSPSRPCVW